MAEKRKQDGFNLAFLDVMACGLGAVLMILIVIKFNANTAIPSDELEKLQQELTQLQQSEAAAKQQSATSQADLNQQSTSLSNLQQRIAQLQQETLSTNQAIQAQKAVVADLQDAVAAAAPKQADDLIKVSGTGEEKYLLGLKVEGQSIAILVDASASMTDDNLLDILKRKSQIDAVKRAGPKWQRTLRTVKWLLARLPKGSQVTVVAFNTQASVLGSRPVNSAKVEASLQAIVRDLNDLVPQGGTNLQLGLQSISQAMPDMSNLYVITDGLPTLLSKGSGFSSSRSCKPEDPSVRTITGDCRLQVFQHSFARFAPRVSTNIVLLPLEGDTQAPAAYWNWSNATGGLMISPAGTWP